ncbi:MAG: ATP-binding protein [Ruminiclostridium sp.]
MSKVPFNVDAYTAKLIGRENVSKLDGAILELVKNTYDADASICFLYYENETDTLYIGDNGTGMSEEVILKHWMTIGSSSKKIQYKTQKGRIQTGAKGIGRFALDRIADKCELLTISDKEHLKWDVDWTIFEFGQRITDITADLEPSKIGFDDFIADVKNKEVIKIIRKNFTDTGSIFKLTSLRDNWDNSVVESIKSNLRTLIPPEFKEIFNVYFFESSTSVEDAAVLQEGDDFPYDYKVHFVAESSGKVSVKIYRDEFDFSDRFDEIMTGAGFGYSEREYFKGKPIQKELSFTEVIGSKEVVENTIGEFEGTLYFAKLNAPKGEKEKYFYKDITGRPDIRNTFGGIRIYRDGFRVRPYGDPKSSSNDWVMLAARKNKSPAAISHETGAWRVNADQMHGSIYISRTNIYLPDQANRQGIVETKEFGLLRLFIENVIRLFERDRQYVCRILNKYFDKLHPTKDIEKEIQKKLQEDKKNEEIAKKNNQPPAALAVIDVKKVSELVEKKDSTIRELENEIQMLRVLATTGIITNTYVHEIKDVTHKLNLNIVMAKEAIEYDSDMQSALDYINKASIMRQALTSWFKVTIESVRRDKRSMKKTSINILVSKLIDSWKESLSPKRIEIVDSIDEVVFMCFPYEIESILNNLVANSVAAFDKKVSDNKKIFISISEQDTGIIIKYSDNGIGLSQTYKKNPRLILDPFETDKVTNGGEVIGTGMGLWIINRIVSEYYGSIDLSKNISSVEGFHIDISLKNRLQEEIQ